MKKPGGMIIGQAGVKYGLQVKKPAGGAAGAAAAAAAAGAKKPPASVFGADSDSEEETVGAQVQRQAYAKKADSKVRASVTVRCQCHCHVPLTRERGGGAAHAPLDQFDRAQSLQLLSPSRCRRPGLVHATEPQIQNPPGAKQAGKGA